MIAILQYKIGSVSILITDEAMVEDDSAEQDAEGLQGRVEIVGDEDAQAALGQDMIEKQAEYSEDETSAENEQDGWNDEILIHDREIRGGEDRNFYGIVVKKAFRKSEGQLLNLLEEHPEWSDFELLQSTNKYPFLYHLSEERGYITEVMGLSNETSVLEIGGECGGVTGALLRQAGTVDCVCSSELHATINAMRNRKREYSIYVGPLESLQIEKKYDVVTLIGSLSYASRYSDSEQPFANMLRFAVERLAPGGRLFIATENTIGMKFLAGAAYDYRIEAFVNLQYPSYSTERSPYRTFTKSQLKDMLAGEGLDETYFYYPYPDYKFPNLIYSDDMYMEPSYLNAGKEFQFRRLSFFNESMAYITLNGTEEIKTLANSFLVEAWKSV